MSRYPYVERDLLAGEVEHYMYSPFEGAGFLVAYRASRCHFRDRLAADLGGVENGIEAARAAICRIAANEEPNFPPPPGWGRVDTVPLLRSCILVSLDGSAAGHDRARAWVAVVLPKFEYAKRLRAAYDAAGKPATSDRVGAAGYALLAGLIGGSAGIPMDLRRLNALLKLNDLLASTDLEAAEELSRAAALLAVERELAEFRDLVARKGIALADDGVGR